MLPVCMICSTWQGGNTFTASMTLPLAQKLIYSCTGEFKAVDCCSGAAIVHVVIYERLEL